MAASEKIINIPQLVDYLNSSDVEGFKKVAGKLEIPVEDWGKYAFFSETKYTRNCVARNDAYELILLCWEPGQITPVHCHNDQECWVHCIQGSFEEQRYVAGDEGGKLKKDHQLHLMSERTSYMNDGMGYHSLANSSNGRAMTLHLYAGPINRARIYNQELTKFEWVEMEYYSMQGKLLAPTNA